MFTALLAGGLLTALATVIGVGVNAYSQHKTNEANMQINQEQLDYAKSTTQEQWERDDTAHQREVADLEKAGLSPLANTSGAQVTSANMPTNPLAYQAPQLDLNSLVQVASTLTNAKLRSDELEEDKRHNMNIEKARDTELANQAKQLENEAENLRIENKKVEENIKIQAKLANIESQRVAEIIRSNKKSEELTLSAQESLEIERESKRYYQEVLKQSGGKDIPYKEYSHSFEAYQMALQIYNAKFQVFISKIGATQSAHAEGSSKSQNGSFGVGANVPGTPFNVNPSASGGSSSSKNTYSSENLSKKQEAMLEAWHKENPIPIWIDREKYKYHSEGRY